MLFTLILSSVKSYIARISSKQKTKIENCTRLSIVRTFSSIDCIFHSHAILLACLMNKVFVVVLWIEVCPSVFKSRVRMTLRVYRIEMFRTFDKTAWQFSKLAIHELLDTISFSHSFFLSVSLSLSFLVPSHLLEGYIVSTYVATRLKNKKRYFHLFFGQREKICGTALAHFTFFFGDDDDYGDDEEFLNENFVFSNLTKTDY